MERIKPIYMIFVCFLLESSIFYVNNQFKYITSIEIIFKIQWGFSEENIVHHSGIMLT
jgi:hypothetical protein